MHKVDVLTDLPKLCFVNKKFVQWLKKKVNDCHLSVCNLQLHLLERVLRVGVAMTSELR